MKALQLLSVGACLPSRVVTNDDLAKVVDTSDEWITSRTGIKSRHFCSGDETVTTLAINAARQAMERSGLSVSDIGAIIVGTVSAENATPSTACMVQAELGFPENIPAFDVNAACTGFMYGVEVAHGLLNTLGGEYALVIGCEELTRIVDQTDRSTCVIFADGAGAGVFKLVNESEDAPYSAVLGSKGSKVLYASGVGVHPQHYLEMDGSAVFRFAVDAIPKCINEVLDKSHMTLDGVQHVVCHQANERIIDHCVKKSKSPASKFFKNLDHTGNTSAASIPLALNEMYEAGILKHNDNLICVGFGAGLTWAGVLFKYVGGNV